MWNILDARSNGKNRIGKRAVRHAALSGWVTVTSKAVVGVEEDAGVDVFGIEGFFPVGLGAHVAAFFSEELFVGVEVKTVVWEEEALGAVSLEYLGEKGADIVVNEVGLELMGFGERVVDGDGMW